MGGGQSGLNEGIQLRFRFLSDPIDPKRRVRHWQKPHGSQEHQGREGALALSGALWGGEDTRGLP